MSDSQSFYGIYHGIDDGSQVGGIVTTDWNECARLTQGVSGPSETNGVCQRKFETESAARRFAETGEVPDPDAKPGVQKRRNSNQKSNSQESASEFHLQVLDGEDLVFWYLVEDDEIIDAGYRPEEARWFADVKRESLKGDVSVNIKESADASEEKLRAFCEKNAVLEDNCRDGKIGLDSSEEKSLEEKIEDAGADLCNEVTEAKPEDFPEGRWFAWYPRAFAGNVVGFLGDGELYLIHHAGEQKRVEVDSREEAIKLAAKHLRRDNEQADTGSDSLPDHACGKCGGTGYIPAYSHVAGGVCFRCDGTGRKPAHA